MQGVMHKCLVRPPSWKSPTQEMPCVHMQLCKCALLILKPGLDAGKPRGHCIRKPPCPAAAGPAAAAQGVPRAHAHTMSLTVVCQDQPLLLRYAQWQGMPALWLWGVNTGHCSHAPPACSISYGTLVRPSTLLQQLYQCRACHDAQCRLCRRVLLL